MKPKLWILIVVLSTLTIYIVRYTSIDYINQKIFENSPLYNHGYWINDNLRPDVVFLGSSMTRYSMDPSIINTNSHLKEGQTINLGTDAATPYEMYITYMQNKKKFSKTKIFFYSIEPWIFSKKYYQFKVYEKVLWTKEEWQYYMPQWDYYHSYKSSLFKLSIDAKYPKHKVKNYGYAKKYFNKLESFRRSNKKDVLDFFTDELYSNIAISTFQLEYLKKLKEEIEKNHSEFIVSYIPNHISYTEAIFKYNKAYNNALSLLLTEHLGDTKQVGSYCPKHYYLKEEDFFDRFHLAETGARKFTQSLGDILDIPNTVKKKEIVLDYSCSNVGK